MNTKKEHHNLSIFEEDNDVLATMGKNIHEIKFNDRLSNSDIIDYSQSSPRTNKKTLLSDAINISEEIQLEDSSENKPNMNISSLPESNDTGLMD